MIRLHIHYYEKRGFDRYYKKFSSPSMTIDNADDFLKKLYKAVPTFDVLT